MTKLTAAFRNFANAPNMDTRVTISVESSGTARISMELATLRRYRPRLLTMSILDFTTNACNN